MDIRKASIEDADAIAHLLTQLGYPGTEGFIREKIVELGKHPDVETVVAVENDRILGFISIHFIPQIALIGSFARISYLCVDAPSCGRGIGQKLESYCMDLAKKKGCNRIELHCHARRIKAHAFYHRQGYSESSKYFEKRL